MMRNRCKIRITWPEALEFIYNGALVDDDEDNLYKYEDGKIMKKYMIYQWEVSEYNDPENHPIPRDSKYNSWIVYRYSDPPHKSIENPL